MNKTLDLDAMGVSELGNAEMRETDGGHLPSKAMDDESIAAFWTVSCAVWSFIGGVIVGFFD
ncbi:MAG: hypothetical protein LBG96_06515 [Tannerella sp.]|jgi:hypothetical protein|nr:hypothetical protein [Tannerella sp.]